MKLQEDSSEAWVNHLAASSAGGNGGNHFVGVAYSKAGITLQSPAPVSNSRARAARFCCAPRLAPGLLRTAPRAPACALKPPPAISSPAGQRHAV